MKPLSTNSSVPLVSILTPSYNSAAFIEETIQSVKSQDYPNIEHIVVDGGSADGTVEILEGYPNVKWLSEPDNGQSDALNKAFALSQGDIIGWLNADDLYEPGAVAAVIEYFVQHPDTYVVHGNCTVFKSDGIVDKYYQGPCDKEKLSEPWRGFHGAYQPSVFYRREAIERIGGWAVDLHYVMDYDLLLRLAEFYPVEYIDVDLSRFRLHPDQKGALAWHRFVREFMLSVERFWCERNIIRYWRYRFLVRHFYALSLLEQITRGTAGNAAQERVYLKQAVAIAPVVLKYAWVQRRCVREILGPALTNLYHKCSSTYRSGR